MTTKHRHLLVNIATFGFPLVSSALAVGWLLLRVAEGAPPRFAAVQLAQKAVASETPVANPKPEIAANFVGAGSCASNACHGGPPPQRADIAPTWRNAYTLWFAQKDPHRQAYAVLQTERSRQMLWLLDAALPANAAKLAEYQKLPADPERKRFLQQFEPQKDARCLVCHSSLPSVSAKLPQEILADGVSCEACHGPARGWLEQHTLESWANKKAARLQSFELECAAHPAGTTSGIGNELPAPQVEKTTNAAGAEQMGNTKDLVSRANLCVRCHVGGGDREVNHDLIAAGHPRLFFEYNAFMANLPRHWNDSLDRAALAADPRSMAPRPTDEGARLWVIGQAAAGQAAAAQLAQRVNRAAKPSAVSPGRLRPAWPEFSEYDCYACHHDLKSDSWRRAELYPDPHALAGGRKPGELPWGSWYFSAVQELPIVTGNKTQLTDARKTLAELLGNPWLPSDPVKVQQPAERLCAELAAIAAPANLSQPWSGKRIETLLAELSKLHAARPITGWDDAAQYYLAVLALTDARNACAARGESGLVKLDEAAFRAQLIAVRELLRFDDPAAPPDQRRLAQSPRHFQLGPTRTAFAKLVELLQPLTAAGSGAAP